jgi:CheY-like chemotaxis protein
MPTASQWRVLIADDVRDVAESLALWLEMQGARTWLASDGQAALELATKHRPSIALLDLEMPKLTGFELAARLREQPWGRDLVLIAISGWGRPADIEAALAAGFDAHLLKPYDPERLSALIEQLLTRPAR